MIVQERPTGNGSEGEDDCGVELSNLGVKSAKFAGVLRSNILALSEGRHTWDAVGLRPGDVTGVDGVAVRPEVENVRDPALGARDADRGEEGVEKTAGRAYEGPPFFFLFLAPGFAADEDARHLRLFRAARVLR